MRQLSGGILHIQLSLGDNLRGKNECHSTGIFARSIAGMTSQIRLLWLISRGDYLHWLMAWQGLESISEIVITFLKICIS